MSINDNVAVLSSECSLCAVSFCLSWDGCGTGTAARFLSLRLPPVPPPMGWTTLLCLGLQVGIWCHGFRTRASGRAWEKGNAWRACREGRAPVRSSRLKKVV